MTRTAACWAAAVLILASGSPALARGFTFSGPEVKEGLFAIGWSKQGTRLAYGWFETTQMISNGSRIVIAVQDLVTDKLLLDEQTTWDEGNAGGDDSQYYPASATAAWQQVSARILPLLTSKGIVAPAGAFQPAGAGEDTLRALAEQGRSIALSLGRNAPTLTLEARKLGSDHLLFAALAERGQKKITAVPEEAADRTYIGGYILNPGGTRLGVVLREQGDHPYSGVTVIGCNLKKGFTKGGPNLQQLEAEQAQAHALEARQQECARSYGVWSKGECRHDPIEAAGLLWTRQIAELDWPAAKKHCEEQQMRLPTRAELVRAYKSRVEALRLPAASFWSADEAGAEAWMLYLVYGGKEPTPSKVSKRTQKNCFVRCVRAPGG